MANTGAIVSRVNVMVCEEVDVLLHESLTVQVLVTDLLQPVPVSGPLLKVAIRPVEQLSVTVAVPNALLISVCVGLHNTVVAGVKVISGAIVSKTVINCTADDILPQASVNVHVLVIIAGHTPEGGLSVPTTVPDVSQLSV